MNEHDGWAAVRPRNKGSEQRRVTVCDTCLRASCWGGVFMCSQSGSAGTVNRTVAELRALDREHSDWWSPETYERMAGRR